MRILLLSMVQELIDANAVIYLDPPEDDHPEPGSRQRKERQRTRSSSGFEVDCQGACF